jgi:hypothetical protein
MPKIIKQRPVPLQLNTKSNSMNKSDKSNSMNKSNTANKSNKRNKRKIDETNDDEENEENNMMHPLRQTDIYRNLQMFNKKEKIDKTIFTPRIVSGIIFPTLPKGFMPIPDYDYDSDSKFNSNSEYDADSEDELHPVNLLMLAEVITNLEKL